MPHCPEILNVVFPVYEVLKKRKKLNNDEYTHSLWTAFHKFAPRGGWTNLLKHICLDLRCASGLTGSFLLAAILNPFCFRKVHVFEIIIVHDVLCYSCELRVQTNNTAFSMCLHGPGPFGIFFIFLYLMTPIYFQTRTAYIWLSSYCWNE